MERMARIPSTAATVDCTCWKSYPARPLCCHYGTARAALESRDSGTMPNTENQRS